MSKMKKKRKKIGTINNILSVYHEGHMVEETNVH